jgi:hypothetical protein
VSTVPTSGHGPYLTPEEQQQSDDYDWALRDAEVQAKYRGMVVAVYKKEVLGAGKTHGEATQAAMARPDCPAKHLLAKVYIEGTPLGGPTRRDQP